MKNKLSSVVLKTLPVVLMATFAASASAQKAGDNVISAGWMYLNPFDSSDPMKVTAHPNPAVIGVRPNTGASVSNANTLGIAYTRFVTDNFSVTVDAGIPPKFKLNAQGAIAQAGVGEIGSANQLSPAVLAKWHFLESNAKIRPFVGLGLTYVWYSNIKSTDNFQNYMSALTGGAGARTDIKLSSSFAPVLNAGVSYAIDDKWSLNFSASYIPLKTKAELTTVRGPVTVRSETELKLNPLVTFLSVGYKF
jgi:outer membrane protein